MNSANETRRPEHEAWFMHGIELYEQDKLQEAFNVFSQLVEKYPDSVGGLIGLAYIWREYNQPETAIGYLEKAIQLSPVSELASIGLHHALRECGLRREAYEEMKRFYNTAGIRPSIYEQLVNDLVQALDIKIEACVSRNEVIDMILVELERAGQLERRS